MPKVKGLPYQDADRTLEDLAQEFQSFEPPPSPSVDRVAIGPGREVLSVARRARVPVAFRGVAYERVLNTTRTLPRGTYQRPLLEQMHATPRWDPAWAGISAPTRVASGR